MVKRRKHRIMVDVTFNRALSHRDAAKAFNHKLSQFGIGDNPIYYSGPDLYVDRF